MKSIIIKYSKYILTLLAVATMAVGLLMPAQIKAADSYNKDKKGSITINLDDVKQGDSITNKANVSISIYQVASISHDGVNISFDIVSSLKSTGVDVNDITTSDKNLNAAKKLTTVIDNSGISAVTKKTDSNGKVSFTDLAQGMYLVEEKDSASYGMFSPFLVAIPYMEDGQNWIYDVEYLGHVQIGENLIGWDSVLHLCDYFYENKDFYRKVMKVEDQNSFINHFRDIVSPLMEEDIREILGEKTDAEFYVNFFCDAVICAFGRWISQKEPLPPKEFVNMMKSSIKVVAITQERMENE